MPVEVELSPDCLEKLHKYVLEILFYDKNFIFLF